MLAWGDLGMSMRIVAMVAPVAVYFLILGLLNSRRHPQLLTGRKDFTLLVTALGPVVFLPAMGVFGYSMPVLVAVAAVLVASVVLLAPPGRSWVVYNLSGDSAADVLSGALRNMGLEFTRRGERFLLTAPAAEIELNGFSLLRNVTIRMCGGDDKLAGAFQRTLAARLGTIQAKPNAMAVSLLLVSTAMLTAPLALMAQNMPQIVRVLTGLLY